MYNKHLASEPECTGKRYHPGFCRNKNTANNYVRAPKHKVLWLKKYLKDITKGNKTLLLFPLSQNMYMQKLLHVD